MSLPNANRKVSGRMKLLAVLAVLAMISSAWVFAFHDSDDSSAAPGDTMNTQTVTYYPTVGSDTNGVSASYYDIASSEYNPQFWNNTGKITAANWVSGTLTKSGLTLTLKGKSPNSSGVTITFPSTDEGTVGGSASYTVTGVSCSDSTVVSHSGNVITLNATDTSEHTVTVTYSMTYYKVFGGWTDGVRFAVSGEDVVVFDNPTGLTAGDFIYNYDPNVTYTVSRIVSSSNVKTAVTDDVFVIDTDGKAIVIKKISDIEVGGTLTADAENYEVKTVTNVRQASCAHPSPRS